MTQFLLFLAVVVAGLRFTDRATLVERDANPLTVEDVFLRARLIFSPLV